MRFRGKGLRRQARREVNAGAALTWEDTSGARFFLRGVCRNYSETGAGLLLPEPVPVHRLVGIEIPSLGLKATATVRYCRRGVKGYYVGLSATAASGWWRTPRG